MSDAATGEDWTDAEIAASVTDYLAMLRAELAGEHYSKTVHRRALMGRLGPGRTEAAVEFKHQNISAVMLELGLPYVRGYRPARNYQGALAAELRRRLSAEGGLLRELQAGPHPRPAGPLARGARPPARVRPRRPHVVDFEALQAENRRMGAHGERLVVDFERVELTAMGRADLASRVRWVAGEDGDGAGFDVHSFTASGEERFIEVKTTALGPETPFYLSSAELSFAVGHVPSYVIYRLYEVNDAPAFFTIDGDVSAVLEFTPVTFRVRLK